MNESPRVVFDTNILFSSIGWQGNPYHCVQAARGGECLSVTCGPILLELAEKLQLKRGFDPRRTAEITEEIRAFSKVVAITGALKVVADDPDDDIVVECAVVGGAQFIVSGDRHLLALKDHGDIRIVRAADFLKLILKQRGVWRGRASPHYLSCLRLTSYPEYGGFLQTIGKSPKVQISTFFIGAAIEAKMAGEIWALLKAGTLENAANLTDENQIISITRWLCTL